jgi:hypothetical protein
MSQAEQEQKALAAVREKFLPKGYVVTIINWHTIDTGTVVTFIQHAPKSEWCEATDTFRCAFVTRDGHLTWDMIAE